MRKFIAFFMVAVVSITLLAGCSTSGTSKPSATPSASSAPSASTSVAPSTTALKKIVVGASPTPHAEILKIAKDILATQGYELEIIEFTDYVQPNIALTDKTLDANYFQHQPYLDDYNKENKTDIISIGSIHFEPLGIYAGKTKAIADLQDGAQVAVPNDTTNEARALLLLESQGLIKVNPDAGLKATVKDITENPKNLKIVEIEAAQLARSLPDVDLAVINGNYAIQAGLNVSKDALAGEAVDSVAAKTFANIIAARNGDEKREDLKALIAALESPEVKDYIEKTYQGSVVPTF